MGRFSVDRWGQWRLRETATALPTQQGVGHRGGGDLPVPSAVRMALSSDAPGPGACLSSFYLHTCLPSLHPHPAFSSPAAFTFILPLSAFLAALRDHQAPPSPVRPAPGPSGSQPVVSFKPSMTPC